MSPHLWQRERRGKRKKWEGILPSSYEITNNKWNEGAKTKAILPQHFEKEWYCTHFYPRLKINMYLDEYLKYLDEF